MTHRAPWECTFAKEEKGECLPGIPPKTGQAYFEILALCILQAALALLIRKNVTLACATLFIPLPLACWLLGLNWSLALYSIALPSLIGFTHFLRVRRQAIPQT